LWGFPGQRRARSVGVVGANYISDKCSRWRAFVCSGSSP
jgi:hypothetical protein